MRIGDFLGKRYFIIILVSVAIYSSFLFFSDFDILYSGLQNFQLSSVTIILLVISASWMVLFGRWYILLNKHGIKIPIKTNLLVFFSGFTLSISPVKSGELIKSFFLKNKCGIPATKTVPIIFLERFYDIIGTAAVASIGVTFLGFELGIVLILIPITIIGLFYLFYTQIGFTLTLKIINRIKFVNKFSNNIKESHEIIRNSSDKKIMTASTGLTILWRLIEGLAILLILQVFGIDFIEFLNLISMYSASVILGAITLSPGGLGVTEGSFAGLLTLHGLDLQTTLALAIFVRFFTLWFGLIIGFISLKILGQINPDE